MAPRRPGGPDARSSSEAGAQAEAREAVARQLTDAEDRLVMLVAERTMPRARRAHSPASLAQG
jgi:hypothetical protein